MGGLSFFLGATILLSLNLSPLTTAGSGAAGGPDTALLATDTPRTLASSGCFFFFLKDMPLAMLLKTFFFFFLVPPVAIDSDSSP
ncbi:hypothetical protein ACHAW6_010720, partial [Cyclotella cf. meneghiniana]